MYSDSTIHFLKSNGSTIVARWWEVGKQELDPEVVASRWFQQSSLMALFSQILDAFESRVYRDLNRTIDQLIRHEETPSPLDIKVLLGCFVKATRLELESAASEPKEAKVIAHDLEAMGRSLKQVYSERLCPQLITVLTEHRDDLRERWLRDLPTARISDHFSLLSEDDREAFVDQTMQVYEAILRGRELEGTPSPHDPSQTVSVLDAWIIKQIDYFNPKGFSLVTVLRAVEHLPRLLEPLLARSTSGDAWTYRTSLLLLIDARNSLVHPLAETYMERFSKNFYGEVGIMLHRIKNKLTSVPTTMQTVLAVSGDDQYETMFDPMVMTMAEAETWGEYDRLAQAALTAQNEMLNGAAGEPSPDALARLREANEQLRAFLADKETEVENIRMLKLDVGSVEILLEMLNIVLEGGKQTEELTKDLQLRMNEMYEREPPRREVMEVSELLQTAVAEAEVDARAKDIDFAIQDEAKGLQILGVRREIGRPFVQVIDNAIKYTPSGGQVQVSLRPDGPEHVLFACKDNGIGIPPGEEDLVFSLCERCSNAKDFAGGTGTGLYHDRITVMHHNGEMWCESGGMGHGTTMYIRLPLYQEAAEQVGAGE
ncbi:MAG: HAMP domain-containing histidine kinase [Armatimonadetes bacterium]|nr:HAMP domain-containing histidine kinase [Armatimonadota bacterium]